MSHALSLRLVVLLAAALVVSLSFLISRFLQHMDLELPLLRAWGGFLSLLLFYAIVRVDFFGDWRFWDFTWADDLVNHTAAVFRERLHLLIGVPLLWLFWLRGILRGQQYIGFDSVVGSFAIGVVIIAPVVLLAQFTDASLAATQPHRPRRPPPRRCALRPRRSPSDAARSRARTEAG